MSTNQQAYSDAVKDWNVKGLFFTGPVELGPRAVPSQAVGVVIHHLKVLVVHLARLVFFTSWYQGVHTTTSSWECGTINEYLVKVEMRLVV